MAARVAALERGGDDDRAREREAAVVPLSQVSTVKLDVPSSLTAHVIKGLLMIFFHLIKGTAVQNVIFKLKGWTTLVTMPKKTI